MDFAVSIKIIGCANFKFVHLNLNPEDNLSKIRNILETQHNIMDMLLFLKKIPKKDDHNTFDEIEREDEEKFILDDITESGDSNHTLYLKELSQEFFNDKCKLDYGCTMSSDGIKRANERAFTMKSCELNKIGVEGYKMGKLQFESNKDWMMKKNLF